MAATALDIVTWEILDELVEGMANQIGDRFTVMLVISRGGLVPAGMLAYRLGIRNVLVASSAAYDDGDTAGSAPVLLEFPEAERLRDRDVLVVDEVWDSGRTIALVVAGVLAAGGRPTTAVLHYKPGRSRVGITPDHYAVSTDAWVRYPFKAGR